MSRRLWLINLLSVLVIMVFGSLWAERSLLSLDLTEGKLYTLSPATKKILLALERPVTIKVFFSKDIPYPYSTTSRYVLDMLQDYKRISKGRIRIDRPNPDDEDFERQASTYGIPAVQVNAIEGDQIQIKKVFLGLAFVSEEKIESLPVITDVSDLEYRITSTIKALVTEEKKTVGFLKGHGVLQCNLLKEALKRQYRVKDVDLKEQDLKGLDVLIIAGPSEKLKKEELVALDQFILKGGRVLLLVQRLQGDLQFGFARPVNTGIEELLNNYGIEVPAEAVYDASAGLVNVSQRRGGFIFTTLVPYPFFPKIIDLNRDHIITKDVEALTLGFTSPIKDRTSSELQFIPLARTSARSGVLKQPLYVAFDRKFPPGAFSGPPQTVAALVAGKFKSPYADKKPEVTEGQSRIIVVGNAELASDDFIRAPGNAQFLLNAIDYLGEDESLIAIRSKQVQTRPIKRLSKTLQQTIKYAVVLGPTTIVVLAGLALWSIRRSRRVQL